MVAFVTIFRALLLAPALLSALVSAQDTTTTDIIPPPLSDTNIFPSTTDPGNSVSVTDIPATSADPSGLSSTLPTDSSTTTTTAATDISSSDSLTSPTDLPTSTPSLTSTTDSTSSSSTSVAPPPPPQSDSSHSSNAGAIAGGVVGGLAGLAIIAGLIFLYLRRRNDYRGRTGRVGGAMPPSPRLKSPWLGGIGLGGSGAGTKKPPRAQRLGSVDDKRPQTSPGDGHGTSAATSDDAHELGVSSFAYRNGSGSINGSAAAAAGTAAGRHRSSASRTSLAEDARANSRSSYDLSVFNSNSNVGVPRGSSRQADPFSSDTSFGGVAASGASDLSRGASSARLARKPAPKYSGDSEPSSPISPSSARQSKPPVSGLPRARTSSNSSSMRAQAAANASVGESSSRSSLENPQLTHKSSQGTLGGAFKFAGEKEGPVHYLIPDPPAGPA